MIRRLLFPAGVVLLVLALLAPAAAWVVDSFLGRDVRFIAPHAAEVVELQRSLWLEGDGVADLYGIPAGDPARVVSPDASRLLIPPEDPTLTLMRVDKTHGDNPLQVKTVWFFTYWGGLGLGISGLVLLVAARLFRPRR